MARYRIVISALFLLATAFAQTPAQSSPQPATSATTPSADQPPPPPATPGGATHVMGFEEAKRGKKRNEGRCTETKPDRQSRNHR